MSASAAKHNLREICRITSAAVAQVLLAGSTGRLGDHPLYTELAQELQLPLHEKGWATVLSDARLRSDRAHANAQGYRQFAKGLARQLRQTGWLP